MSSGRPPALVLASENPGKLREFERLLSPFGWAVVPARAAGFSGMLLEPGSTYTENALAKAAAVCAALGVAALGDDSGIEVEALAGWPGPLSARWLGPHADDQARLRALLEAVKERTPEDRRVRYVAALALARPTAEPIVAHGGCHGVLVEPSGSGGFGYDPAFWSVELRTTFGEADDRQKDTVSHRARAVMRLAESGALSPSRLRSETEQQPLFP